MHSMNTISLSTLVKRSCLYASWKQMERILEGMERIFFFDKMTIENSFASLTGKRKSKAR